MTSLNIHLSAYPKGYLLELLLILFLLKDLGLYCFDITLMILLLWHEFIQFFSFLLWVHVYSLWENFCNKECTLWGILSWSGPLSGYRLLFSFVTHPLLSVPPSYHPPLPFSHSSLCIPHICHPISTPYLLSPAPYSPLSPCFPYHPSVPSGCLLFILLCFYSHPVLSLPLTWLSYLLPLWPLRLYDYTP